MINTTHLNYIKMKTLKLFNAVLSKSSKATPFISDQGFIIEPNAIWAKDQIIDFYTREQLNGNDLNKTFHKSWAKIKNSSRFELLIEQIRHYISTYGSNFQDEIYIPDEVLNIPETKLTYKVIRAYTKDEFIDKCLSLLKSGIALKEETINDLLSLLIDELGYQIKGDEGIKNKEAIVKLADMYGILPKDIMAFFRYIIYRATGQSLLIKSKDVILKVKETNFNPSAQFNQFGLEKLATVFNRFKPLFLAFKGQCPKTINKIAKLSKTHHKPMVSNPLNFVTSMSLEAKDSHWLDNATPFALFKALSACYSRKQGQDSFVYRIRNGKSWTTTNNASKKIARENYEKILSYLKGKYDLSGKKIFLPKGIKYALPTSEKMFVGNIPTGTRFIAKKMAVGIYWEDTWGARDLDLSGMNIGGKVGWNSVYKFGKSLYFSGDITSAPKGAVEYLYANNGLDAPTLVMNNIYSGNDNSGYKIIIGAGDGINKDYMMNPNNLFTEVKCEAIQKQMVLGIFIPKKDKQSFIILNFGAGHTRVSGNSQISITATKALYQKWNKPLSFNKIIKILGCQIVEKEKCDIDYSIEALEKDSFIKIFE